MAGKGGGASSSTNGIRSSPDIDDNDNTAALADASAPNIDENDNTAAVTDALAPAIDENDDTGTAATTAATSAPNEAVENVNEDDLQYYNEDDEDDANVIRNREKYDIWHEFDNLNKLLGRSCTASPAINQLLWSATHAINAPEENNVQTVLASKGVEDFYAHFFYNREYWLQRVRCPPRKADVASANLLSALDYLKDNEVFAEYVSLDVEKFIKGWARRCREGRYDDLPDVEMYRHNGYDSAGLDLWLRNRGSRAENFHQKMKVACGQHGIGVEMAHYLHLTLSYRYLVNAGIARCEEPDFGHSELHLKDRIQTRVMELWGVLLFSNWVNVSQFRPIDFVAVGLGPLSLDEKYGSPECLKGDLLMVIF